MSDVAIEPLKRCPFCGSKDVGPWDDQSPSTIECYTCGVTGPEAPPEEPGSMMRGRDYWNSRGKIEGLIPLKKEESGVAPMALDIPTALPCPFCGSKDLEGTCDTPEQAEKTSAILNPDDPVEAARFAEYLKSHGTISCVPCGTYMNVEKANPLKEWNFRMPTNGL